MKRFSLFAFAAVAMLVVGCTKDVDTDVKVDDGIVRGELVTKQVIIEESRLERDEATGKLSWNEGDAVAVVLNTNDSFTLDTKTYTIDHEANTVTIPDNAVYMFYPASIAKSINEMTLSMTLPLSYSVATPEDIFDHNPMRGFVDGDFVTFSNLLGYVKVPLTGEGTLKSVTVKSEIFNGFKPMSQSATLNLNNQNANVVMSTTNTARAWVKVAFTDDVQLSASPAVYVPVPANTYDNMALVIETDNGANAIYANNSHTISKSKVKPVSSSAINVTSPATATSLCGTSGTAKLDYANTYIVPPTAGNYSFKAILADGTALKGGVTAEIVWAEEAGMFNNFHYNPETNVISFKSNGTRGNALITLSKNINSAETLVWTWLLWCTDEPDVISLEHAKTAGYIYKVMDRMLGATWAPSAKLADQRTTLGTSESWPINASVSATDATNACGLYYQYQNMMPYPRLKNIDATAAEKTDNRHNTRVAVQYGFHQYGQIFTDSDACGLITIDENGQYRSKASKHPNYMYYFNVAGGKANNAGWTYSSIIGRTNAVPEGEYRLWYNTSTNKPAIANKTNHDPCPPGYLIDTYGTLHWTIHQANFNIDSRMGFVRNETNNTSYGAGYRVYGMYINGCKNKAGNDIDLYFPCASNRTRTLVNTTGTYGNTGFLYAFHTDAKGEQYTHTFSYTAIDGEPISGTTKVYHGTSLQYGENGKNKLVTPSLNKEKHTNAQAYNVRCIASKEIYDKL